LSSQEDPPPPNGQKPKTLNDYLTEASGLQTFENMKKLCNQAEYTVAGQTYKRKMLKPKDVIALGKLQNEMDETDPEKRMENIKKQAFICLEGLTEEKWQDTDATYMEIVVGACLLISKGFRQV
jgi:hypothetical protein